MTTTSIAFSASQKPILEFVATESSVMTIVVNVRNTKLEAHQKQPGENLEIHKETTAKAPFTFRAHGTPPWERK